MLWPRRKSVPRQDNPGSSILCPKPLPLKSGRGLFHSAGISWGQTANPDGERFKGGMPQTAARAGSPQHLKERCRALRCGYLLGAVLRRLQIQPGITVSLLTLRSPCVKMPSIYYGILIVP